MSPVYQYISLCLLSLQRISSCLRFVNPCYFSVWPASGPHLGERCRLAQAQAPAPTCISHQASAAQALCMCQSTSLTRRARRRHDFSIFLNSQGYLMQTQRTYTTINTKQRYKLDVHSETKTMLFPTSGVTRISCCPCWSHDWRSAWVKRHVRGVSVELPSQLL